MSPEEIPARKPGSHDPAPAGVPPMGPPTAGSMRATRPEIVYLDPHYERPVSQYSPEGEIRMMGDFAAGLTRRRKVSRPMAFTLVAIILLPILISILAVISSWL
ncbi:MAG: hypothetical protein QOE71_2303 [Pseudonocardiales bacterium]|nr:hypothetical protein [Pseudonocardiales bacterium]MDQ1751247.1 hypothetical protein [Pseudonocardiales bacterium]